MNTLLEVINVAWSTKLLRKYTINDTVKAISKSIELNEADTRMLTKVLIEFALGISAPSGTLSVEPSAAKAMELYRQAVLAKDTYDLGISGEACPSELAEEVLREYLLNLTK